MSIARYVEYFSIAQSNRTGIPALEANLKLQDAFKDASLASGEVRIIDCSGEFVLDRRYRQQTRQFPEFCIVLEYLLGKGIEISQIYADRESLNLAERVASQDLLFTESARGVVDSRKAEFEHEDHCFLYPMDVSFGPNDKKIQTQRNDLQVSCTWNPQEKELRSIKEICAEAHAQVTFYPSQNQNGTWHKQGPHSVISRPLAPEFDLIATWEGSNFDMTAIDLYGKLRKVFGRTHCINIGRYASKIIRSQFPQDEEVSINREEMWPYSGISDMRCHIRCEIPFTHGTQEIVGELSYYNFIGRN